MFGRWRAVPLAAPFFRTGPSMTKPRGRSAEYQKLYKSARWQRLRRYQLSVQPLCEFCLVTETITAADVIDHRKKHGGDLDLFFDPENLQSLCKHHHDSAKQSIERGRKVITYGADGYPIELC
jgi:5-methylcytosine-specific restriction endonuclease McrA